MLIYRKNVLGRSIDRQIMLENYLTKLNNEQSLIYRCLRFTLVYFRTAFYFDKATNFWKEKNGTNSNLVHPKLLRLILLWRIMSGLVLRVWSVNHTKLMS